MKYAIAAWILAALFLGFTLALHLLPALVGGLLVYELVHIIAPRLPGKRNDGGKIAAVALLAVTVVAILTLLMFGVVAFVRSDAGSLARLLQRLAEIVEGSRGHLPEWVFGAMPGDAEGLKAAIITWLRDHATELRTMGGELGHVVAYILIGMVIGAMVSLRERATRLGEAFRRVVFAQVRISALNTLLTSIYLLGILPLFDIHLPLRKTLIAVTFVAGLLPVVGNLISNTVVVLVSLSVSLSVAIASLAYLIVIHKLEYFLNARIVGRQIDAKAWELLLAMLVMEAAFGIPGLIAAPIYYAYLKDELKARGLV